MDFRNIIQKMRQIDPTTPGQDLEHFTQLAESTGIALGAKEVVTEADMSGTVKKSAKAALKKSGMKTEASKPEFLDMDKDGDKKEPMKKAAKDAKKKKEPVKEAEQVIKAEKKQKLPSKKSILMMCGKGMSKSAICKEYSDCDQEKLKEMIESCMEEYKKKKNEYVSFVDMDGEIVEAKSAAQKKAQEKFKNMVKGKKSDDKETDEAKEPKKKKETVKESIETKETKMSFVEMMKLVKESGGQQAIDPLDDILWNWANRVAKSKVEESAKQEIFAAMVYERNGGRFEMYDVVEKGLNESKECNCGPDCACKGNCGDDCNCGSDCGK